MGKGDIKTKKGKITKGTYGVRRPKKSNQVKVVSKKPKKTKTTKSSGAKPASTKVPGTKVPKAKSTTVKEAKPEAKP